MELGRESISYSSNFLSLSLCLNRSALLQSLTKRGAPIAGTARWHFCLLFSCRYYLDCNRVTTLRKGHNSSLMWLDNPLQRSKSMAVKSQPNSAAHIRSCSAKTFAKEQHGPMSVYLETTSYPYKPLTVG